MNFVDIIQRQILYIVHILYLRVSLLS